MKNIVLFYFVFFIVSCNKNTDIPFSPSNDTPIVQSDRRTITFPKNSRGLEQFKFVTASAKGQFISVIAPSHVVASVLFNDKKYPNIILESQELNELYYNYAQAVENRKNNEVNLARVKDMATSMAATQKDLMDAQRDLKNSEFIENEAENKLKAEGVIPKLIRTSKEDKVFLVSDVSENQLQHVEQDEHVDVFFNAYPQDKFDGKVVNIGDVIDPTSRTIKIGVEIKNLDRRIKAGMFAKVEFGDFTPDVISIPKTAVFTINGESYAFIAMTDESFSLTPIEVIGYDEDHVGVVSGIKKNDRIVSEGVLLLKGILLKGQGGTHD